MNRNVLRNLAKLEGNKKVEKTLSEFADKIFTEIKKPGNEAEIYSHLELLNEFSYRVPGQVLEIVGFVLKNRCQNELSDKKWINYGTVTSKCFELLKSIRYLEIENIFDLLASFNSGVVKIQEARNETLKSLFKYNLNVLKQIGLSAQRILLDRIISWSRNEKLKDIEVIKIAIREILQPSLEWSNMIEWNKLQFSRGSLVADKSGNLVKIRKDSIDLIFEMYSFVSDEKEKFELIKVLDEASRTPYEGAEESLERIVKNDVKYLIKKYQAIVFGTENQVICSLPVAMEVERQLWWFKRRWPADNIENIDNFVSKFKKDKRYFIYRKLVDRDRLEYLKRKKGDKKIDLVESVIADIQWLGILNDIAEASKIEEGWKFNDFHAFLTELTEKDVKKGEYFLKDSLQNNSLLLEFSDAFVLGFRNVDRVDLWDKYVKEIVKKKEANLLSKILHSFYFYFKNSKELKFREKDFSLVKSIAERKGEYSFLQGGEYNKLSFNFTFFRSILILWKYKKKEVESLIISEMKKAESNFLESKLGELDLFITWEDIDISKWGKESIGYLVNCLIISKRMDYHIEGLMEEVGKINFNYVIEIIKKRLDLSDRPRKFGDYDSISRHLKKELKALIKENKAEFEREMIAWIVAKDEKLFNSYECGSLFRQLDEIYSDIVGTLIKKDTLDTYEKASAMTRSFDAPNLSILFEIANSVINSKKISNKNKKKIFNRISGSMFSTGLVSGEHGISNEHKRKAEEIEKIKGDLKKNKKSKKLINFADEIIKMLKEQAKREYTDEERQIKRMEIDFES